MIHTWPQSTSDHGVSASLDAAQGAGTAQPETGLLIVHRHLPVQFMTYVKPHDSPASAFPRRAVSILFLFALTACGGGGGGGGSSGSTAARPPAPAPAPAESPAPAPAPAPSTDTGNSGGTVPAPSDPDTSEDDTSAPVDFGAGPVTSAGILTDVLKELAAGGELMTIYKPQGVTPQAYTAGVFGPTFSWPVMPIHMVLLPDGRVLAYGSDDKGVQGAQFHYAVWDPNWNPTLPGADTSPFQLLSNTTGTDLFCSAQLVLPSSGQVLLAGGDRTVNGKRNYATADVNIFNPADNSLRRDSSSMAYRRWYGTAVTTDKGEVVVLGGRDDLYFAGTKNAPATTVSYSTTPEIYVPGTGWRVLSTAQSGEAFGVINGNNWWYPKSWLAPDGRILTITHDGFFHTLDTAGTGTLTQLEGKLPGANWNLPAVMYAPGKILSLRNDKIASLVDINGAQPVIGRTASLSAWRKWGFGTVLADGTVWVNGGSVNANLDADAVYSSELWDPATGQWSLTASAQKPRLYHNSSLLLPSGAVLTGGGGSPGPVRHLNGEVYFPPYLFNPDGSAAARPVITGLSSQVVNWSGSLQVSLGSATAIERVMLVRTGSSTHSFASEQRAKELAFTQNGQTLTVSAPASATEMPPGYYMLFVFQRNAQAPADAKRLVPSQARIVRLG